MELATHRYSGYFRDLGLTNEKIADAVLATTQAREWLSEGDDHDPDFDWGAEFVAMLWTIGIHPADMLERVVLALDLTADETRRLTRLMLDALMEEAEQQWAA
jgi:hypothetical protein